MGISRTQHDFPKYLKYIVSSINLPSLHSLISVYLSRALAQNKIHTVLNHFWNKEEVAVVVRHRHHLRLFVPW